MATQDLNRDLNGLNPLAYLGVNPTTPPQLVTENRVPTVNDYVRFPIGTMWLVPPTDNVFILTSKVGNVATWTPLAQPSPLPIGGMTGQLLSAVTSANSVWTTATYPLTINTGDILIGTAPNVVGAVATAGATSTYVLTANGAGTVPTWQPSATVGGLTWTTLPVPTPRFTIVKNNGYVAENTGWVPVLFKLPATAAVGDTFVLASNTVALFRILQNPGQELVVWANPPTAVGTDGFYYFHSSLNSLPENMYMSITCTSANTIFTVDNVNNPPVGNYFKNTSQIALGSPNGYLGAAAAGAITYGISCSLNIVQAFWAIAVGNTAGIGNQVVTYLVDNTGTSTQKATLALGADAFDCAFLPYCLTVPTNTATYYLAVTSAVPTAQLVVYSYPTPYTTLTAAATVNVGSTCYDLAWNPYGTFLAVNVNNTSISIYSWNGSTTLTYVTDVTPSTAPGKMEWDITGQYLSVATADGFEVYEWDFVSVLTLATGITGSTFSGTGICWSEHGDRIFLGTNDSTQAVKVYSFNGSTLSHVIDITGTAGTSSVPTLSHMGTHLFVTSYSNSGTPSNQSWSFSYIWDNQLETLTLDATFSAVNCGGFRCLSTDMAVAIGGGGTAEIAFGQVNNGTANYNIITQVTGLYEG